MKAWQRERKARLEAEAREAARKAWADADEVRAKALPQPPPRPAGVMTFEQARAYSKELQEWSDAMDARRTKVCPAGHTYVRERTHYHGSCPECSRARHREYSKTYRRPVTKRF